MRQHLKGATALVVTLLAVYGLVASAAGRLPADVPVTATLADSTGSFLYKIGSDNPAYAGASYSTNQTGVSSFIRYTDTGSSWMLYTYGTKGTKFIQSGRGVRFDLSDNPVPGGFPTPIPSNSVWPVYLYVNCAGANVNMVAMGAGDEAVCPGLFRFWQTDTNKWYRLQFNPDKYAGDRIRVNCSESMNPPATGCKTWTISPAGSTPRPDNTQPYPPHNYTTLLQIDAGGSVIPPEGGTYYVSFNFTITR